MNWINEAWAWVVDNIAPLLTATNLIMLLNVMFSLFRQRSNINANTASGKELKQTLKTLQIQRETLEEQTSGLDKLKSEVKEMQEILSHMASKADAELDILHTAYAAQSRLPEEARKAIDAFYTNARYSETKQRAEILKRVKELESKLAEVTTEAAEKAAEVKKLVEDKAAEPVSDLRML